MPINPVLLGKIVILFAIVMASLGYYLGKRKTQTPVLTAVIAFFSALLPPIAIVFLMALVIKNDVQPSSDRY